MSEDVVSRELLERFFAFISDNVGTGHSSLGLELEFFERNGFHPMIANRLYADFDEWVNGFESPLGIKLSDGSYAKEGRDVEFVRNVAIQLRNYLRMKFGKPCLSDSEIDQFTLDFSTLPHWEKRPGLWHSSQGDTYQTSEDDLRAALQFAKKRYPEIIEYSRALSSLSPSQGYSPQDVYGRGMTLSFAADALYATLPSLDNYKNISGIHELESMFRS